MKTPFLVVLVALVLSLGANAQTPAPATPPAAPPPTQEQLWSNLTKYQPDNAKLVPAKNRVVFFGDSITDAWRGDAFFPGKGYENRGISGQTTTQMLQRFREDVIRLHPAVVVILAGTNDIAQNQGPVPLQAIEDNLESMADLARANHIQPVMCSILPATEYGWHPGLDPVHKIPVINAWMEKMCVERHFIFLNYYPALVDPATHGMRKDLSGDGVHPNPAGYALMSPLAAAAIEQALER